MVHCFRARPGRLLATALAVAAFAVTLSGGTAYAAAANNSDVTQTFEQVFLKLQGAPVYEDSCTKTCHGNIAKTKNYASAIKFSHAFHLAYQCSSCHERFPHRADTTIERPTMQLCWGCHGVRHGPQGLVASGECVDCHVTPRDRLRPAFHVFGWEGKEHVAPANKEFNTKCAMCHTPETCTGCHDAEGIRWAPKKWDFISVDGCQQCHASAGLSKASSSGQKSYMVTGLDESAHNAVACQDCHADFRYDDKESYSALWTVNASQACADCHKTAEDGKWSKMVGEYEKSVHYKQLTKAKPNYGSASCSSCHGGHFIYRLKTDSAKARMHLSAYRVCARCHGEDYSTYNDYYHGKAYKDGSLDAPACWDCHGAHDIQPKGTKSSLVSEENVSKTCGQKGCHAGTGETFGAKASVLIHGKAAEESNNPIMKFVRFIKGQK